MAVVTEEYQKRVLDDIENYAGLSHPEKAGLLERIFIKKVSLKKLHPNPKDEFSMPSIGPNFEIVSKYTEMIREAKMSPDEKLVVEKMSTGGYMILNGHHRWLAATRVGIKKYPVEIVNVTPEDKIFQTVNKSKKDKCASFDLDEVLLTDGEKIPKDKNLFFPFTVFYKKTLRKNSPSLISNLRECGFDVWIYTGNFYSEEYIKTLFAIHHIKVDGVVNGLSKRKSNSNLQKIFSEKYKLSLHIDNESVLAVDTTTKNYETLDIHPTGNSWAADVMVKVKDILNKD